MLQPTTEQSAGATPIDASAPEEALSRMLRGHRDALDSMSDAVPAISSAAVGFAETLRGGGTVLYLAAGSSGLAALADVAELPGTFGIPEQQLALCIAGGVPVDARMPGSTEDATIDARTAAAALKPGDLLIALSASGTTPFACAGAETARERGARVIAIANNPETPLLALADFPVLLRTPPEVLAGSTRLGAGTAQKVALNMISTQAGILLGHVHDGMMVNVRADNAKLRARATGMVARIAGVSETDAATALDRADLAVKPAILIARGFDRDGARQHLARHNDQLRSALQASETNTQT